MNSSAMAGVSLSRWRGASARGRSGRVAGCRGACRSSRRRRAAAERWRARGCPYEAARALAESETAEDVAGALREFERLGAVPAARLASERLRALGALVPRRPRPTTRANPAGLTSRELEVLRLIASGLRNAEVAKRLVLWSRTVEQHVSAILRKLNARTRGEAVAAAAKLGLLQDR
jgi:DNA-binding NarL/FixJ family response regulator